jgi:hypothetical protein
MKSSWVYNWEGVCGGPFAFDCSTVEASFAVPLHPGSSFNCFGFDKCIDDLDMVWKINYPDKPSITTVFAPESWFFWNPTATLPGSASICWNSCGDVGIQIAANGAWSLMDGRHYVSGLESQWGHPARIDEPGVLLLLMIAGLALWRCYGKLS